jgi:hypothetical protein
MAADLDRAVGGDSGALDLGHDLRHHAARVRDRERPDADPRRRLLRSRCRGDAHGAGGRHRQRVPARPLGAGSRAAPRTPRRPTGSPPRPPAGGSGSPPTAPPVWCRGHATPGTTARPHLTPTIRTSPNPCLGPRRWAVGTADLAHRMEQLADGGLAPVLANLHPDPALADEVLGIDKPHHCSHRFALAGTGIVPVPGAFTWPTLSVDCCGVDRPALIDPARAGRAVAGPRPEQVDALSALVGRTGPGCWAPWPCPGPPPSWPPSWACARPRSAGTSRSSATPPWSPPSAAAGWPSTSAPRRHHPPGRPPIGRGDRINPQPEHSSDTSVPWWGRGRPDWALIERAKGALMERERLDDQEAFTPSPPGGPVLRPQAERGGSRGRR